MQSGEGRTPEAGDDEREKERHGRSVFVCDRENRKIASYSEY